LLFVAYAITEAALRHGMVTETEMANQIADKVRAAIFQAIYPGELRDA